MPLILDGLNGETFPSWTTATRPVAPVAGQVGFNSTTSTLECYNGSAWIVGGIVAPSTVNNVLKSNGTDWTSGAFPWVVTTVGTSITTTPSSYTIPANAIMVVGTGFHNMSSNNGSRISVNIKNSSGTTLFTYSLTGGNEVPGGDGGSGMSTRSGWMVPIPSTAAGGTLEFQRTSGSGSFTITINQVITFA